MGRATTQCLFDEQQPILTEEQLGLAMMLRDAERRNPKAAPLFSLFGIGKQLRFDLGLADPLEHCLLYTSCAVRVSRVGVCKRGTRSDDRSAVVLVK